VVGEEAVMNLTFEQWIALIGLSIGLLGLVYKWNQGRAIRSVEVHFVYPIGPGTYPTLVSITFINERGPVVVVEQVGFGFPNGRWIPKVGHMPLYDDTLPTKVSSGRSATYCFYLEALRRAVQEEGLMLDKAFCEDEIGHRYETRLNREIRSGLLGQEA